METCKLKRVKNAPPTVYYFPDFISLNEEERILEKVNSAPKPKWTQLSNRRLQNWGGLPSQNGMVAEPIPQWLQNCIEKIELLDLFSGKPHLNHVLVNEYRSGQGIMPHLDGPLYYPTVSTISCGSHTLLSFYEPVDHSFTSNNLNQKILSLLLERRSLVILQDEMYSKYLHGIEEVETDVISEGIANLNCTGEKYEIDQELKRGTRVSLTIRHVPKTKKIKLF